jgi:N-acetylglucosaminyl-diphospho-decaprenol L-rhamnosyltransferase
LSDSPVGAARTDVAIVVVTFNSAAVLPVLIDSLPEGLAGCTWSLVVADNDSKDGTVELARSLAPGARTVEMGRNAGYAAGINAGLAAAEPASAALILNADTRLRPGSVAAMLAGLEEPGIGIVVPRLVDENGVLGPSLRREPTTRRSLADAVFTHRVLGRFDSWSEAVTNPESYSRPTRSDWAAGPVLLISDACMVACGPWDESFFLYSEETEFCLRARDRGFALMLTPDAEVEHLGGGSSLSPKLWSLVVVNRVRLYRRHHNGLASAAFWLVAVLREASRALLGRETSRQALATLLSRRRMQEAAQRAGASAEPVSR